MRERFRRRSLFNIAFLLQTVSSPEQPPLIIPCGLMLSIEAPDPVPRGNSCGEKISARSVE